MQFFSNIASASEAIAFLALSALMMIVCHLLAHGLSALFGSAGSDPHSVSALRSEPAEPMEGTRQRGAARPGHAIPERELAEAR